MVVATVAFDIDHFGPGHIVGTIERCAWPRRLGSSSDTAIDYLIIRICRDGYNDHFLVDGRNFNVKSIHGVGNATLEGDIIGTVGTSFFAVQIAHDSSSDGC